MYYSLKGIVTVTESNYIVVDVSGVGYLVYTPNPYSFKIGEEYNVYVYQHIREDELSLYGFKDIEQKDLFLKLIGVKGLGPRMALPMLATGSTNGIIDAIDRENILYLKKFPKIGDKVARQIILDLKGKLNMSKEEVNTANEELIDVLKGLGYKEKDFKSVLHKVDPSLKIENQVKEALKLLLK